MQIQTFSLPEILAAMPALDSTAKRYIEPFTHGSMRLGVYAPHLDDPQQPHAQDEIYVVVRGSGVMVQGARRAPFAAGDALFVAAGDAHHFEEFSDDFAAWVVFWGPPGGEAP